MPVFLIDFQTKPEKGEDENTGDDGLVKEVLGVYILVRHSHCPVQLSLSRHCSMLTERGTYPRVIILSVERQSGLLLCIKLV